MPSFNSLKYIQMLILFAYFVTLFIDFEFYFILINGMLMQFATETAANGTKRPISGGAFYDIQ